MATPVIQSASTYAWTANTSPVITKPTGLSIGDLMLAIITTITSDGSGADSHTTPAGWTVALAEATTPTATVRTSVFWKIADSGDIAASNFTFVADTTNSVNAGYLARITGHYASNPVTGADGATSASSTTTPTLTVSQNTYTDEALLYMFFTGDNVAVETLTGSGYTIDGTNPTWTERVEDSSTLGIDESFFVASAPEVAVRTVSSISMTASGSGIQNYVGGIIVIAPQVSETGTHTLLSADADSFSPTASSGTLGTNALLQADADFYTTSGTGVVPNIWTPITKS